MLNMLYLSNFMTFAVTTNRARSATLRPPFVISMCGSRIVDSVGVDFRRDEVGKPFWVESVKIVEKRYCNYVLLNQYKSV